MPPDGKDASPERTQTLARDPGEPAAETSDLPDADPRRYDVTHEHARGGLGRVMAARDRVLDRPVAIKELLRPGRAAAGQFVREALITARLQHPSIVPVYDAGRWPDGEPFYAMKLVAGKSLREVIAGAARLDERLALIPSVIAVADAVAYAHSERVIHRDLKPGNILIGEFGQTFVVDWGLARRLAGDGPDGGADGATVAEPAATRGAIGTPQYMAPEQAAGGSVDERADVYSLGAILYHTLAGAPPYPGETWQDVVAAVVAGPPPPLDGRQPGIAVELLAIVRRAMARDPVERYPAARDLAADLRRFQTGQLVSSHEYSAAALLRRWLLRHRLVVSLVAVSLALLAAVGVYSVRRIDAARVDAEAHRDQLILRQARALLDRDPTASLAWLKTYPAGAPDWTEAGTLVEEARSRGAARVVLDDLADARLDEDGRRLAILHDDGAFTELELAHGGRRSLDLRVPGATFLDGAIHPDLRRVVTRSGDDLDMWDAASGARRRFGHIDGETNFISFSPEGKWVVASLRDGTLVLWDVGTGKRSVWAVGAGLQSVRLSHDGRYLAASGYHLDVVHLLDLETGAQRDLSAPDWLWPAELSADGAWVASGTAAAIRLWPVAGGEARVLGVPETGAVWRAVFSPDGRSLASAGEGRVVRLWDLAAGESRVVGRLAGNGTSLAFSADGKRLAAAGQDGVVRIWDLGTGESAALSAEGMEVMVLLLSRDGSRVAGINFAQHKLRLWDVTLGGGPALTRHPAGPVALAFDAAGARLASVGADGLAHVCAPAGASCRVLPEPVPAATWVRFSADGAELAAGGREVRRFALAAGTSRAAAIAAQGGGAFAPDAPLLAVAGGPEGAVRLWDGGGAPRELAATSSTVQSPVFSPDGKYLAWLRNDNLVQLWRRDRGEVYTLAGHRDVVTDLAFAPDGATLATGGFQFDPNIRLWRLPGQPAGVLGGHRGIVLKVRWGGDVLASLSGDHTVRAWDPRAGTSRIVARSAQPLTVLALAPDGKLVAAAEATTIHVWDVATGDTRILRGDDGAVGEIAFSPDGALLAASSAGGAVRLWRRAEFQPYRGEPARVRALLDELTTAELTPDRQAALTPR